MLLNAKQAFIQVHILYVEKHMPTLKSWGSMQSSTPTIHATNHTESSSTSTSFFESVIEQATTTTSQLPNGSCPNPNRRINQSSIHLLHRERTTLHACRSQS